MEWWVSPLTGFTYATKIRITAPSRGADLIVQARTPDQEVSKVVITPGRLEGGGIVTGTFNGKRVWGDAMMEQHQPAPGVVLP